MWTLHFGWCGLQAYSNFSTLPKTNIFAENRPSQNESCLPLPPCFKTKPLVSEGVYDFSNSLKDWWVEMICNLLKANMSPENQWLEEDISIWNSPFLRGHVRFPNSTYLVREFRSSSPLIIASNSRTSMVLCQGKNWKITNATNPSSLV